MKTRFSAKLSYGNEPHLQVYFHATQTHLLHAGTRFETESEGNSEMAYCIVSIQLFRERLSVKSARDNPERYFGFF